MSGVAAGSLGHFYCNAEWGMRNAEWQCKFVPHDAPRDTPHSAFRTPHFR